MTDISYTSLKLNDDENILEEVGVVYPGNQVDAFGHTFTTHGPGVTTESDGGFYAVGHSAEVVEIGDSKLVFARKTDTVEMWTHDGVHISELEGTPDEAYTVTVAGREMIALVDDNISHPFGYRDGGIALYDPTNHELLTEYVDAINVKGDTLYSLVPTSVKGSDHSISSKQTVQ